MFLYRKLSNTLKKLIEQRPLVYLNGARQVGKSTLVQNLNLSKKINYITLDSPFVLEAVKNDATNFLQNLPKDKINIIDEVQIAKELFPILKIEIDNTRLKKQNVNQLYVLTGSANLMALPTLASYLAGRMAILTLYPLSASEYKKINVNFIEKLYSQKLEYCKLTNTDNLLNIIKNSTYPEIALNQKIDRIKWLDDYLSTILQRDVRNIADIKNPEKIITLLSFLATRVGGLLNNSSIMKEIGLDNKTYDKYKALSMNTFLTFEVKSWTPVTKINKKFTKSSKLYFTDINMLCYILRDSLESVYENNKEIFGSIFENFIATEIIKNIDINMDLSYFKTTDNKEVDFVLENNRGEILAIEVKTAKTVTDKDTNALQELQKITKSKFKKGIVFYTGNEIVPMKKDIWAVPVNYIWQE